MKRANNHSARVNTIDENLLFSDYMQLWLEKMRNKVQTTTFGGYQRVVNNVIVPYFEGTHLIDITVRDLQEFYDSELKRVSAETVKRYHANIHKALKMAAAEGRIISNPADFITLPKSSTVFKANCYTLTELKQLSNLVEGHLLEMPVLLATHYGLRKSEVLGMRWSQIDFHSDTIVINHKVTGATTDGKYKDYEDDRMKSSTSHRSFPLIPTIKQRLLLLHNLITLSQQRMGINYDRRYLDYVCVRRDGKRLTLDWITRNFPKFLKDNGLRKIRFHDLRHPYVKLKLKNNSNFF